MVAAIKHMASSFSKLEKFKGVDFRRWQKKMHFMLSTMSVVYVLTTPMLEDRGENPTVEQVRKRAKFQAHLKTFKGGINFDELGSHLRIEESLRVHDSDMPKGNNVVGPSVVSMVEHNNSSRKPGHLKKDYMVGNVGNRVNGSSTKGSKDGSSNPSKGQSMFNKSHQIYYVTYVFEAFFVQDDDVAWLNIVSDNIGSAFMSIFKLKDSILWHARLDHVHFKRMQDISKDGLISTIDVDTKKCKTCMLNKITKKPFQNVKRETKVLELIHSDFCDLHATPSLGNKKYFVTFIDDASRFYVIEPNDSVAINSIIKSRDAIFDEHMFSSQSEPELRKSKRNRTPKDFGLEFKLYLIERTKDEKEAINDEIDSIMGNNTWVLTDIPPGCRPLGCKWIFKRKLKVDGTVEKFKASFLNEELEEEVYMNQPLGFIMPGNKNKLTNACIANFDASGKGVIICLYVDDMLIFGTDQVQVDLTKEFLSSRFSMKDIGEAYVILGIRIKLKSNGIAISQSHYIEKVLKKFNYSDCTSVSTPLDTCEKLMPNRGLAISQLEYSRVIGCLMYAMTCTRPDIAFAVGKLSRYTSNPGTQHWQAIQRVLKYLKKTMDYRLVYSGYPLVLEGYTDASWISNTDDNSSTSDWVFQLGGAAGKEAEWLKNFLLEIPLWVKPIAPISIRYDSVATLEKAYSQMYNEKSRHLGVRHSMIRELITNGVVSIEFMRSQQNLVDHLTKGLARDLVIKSAEGIRLNQTKSLNARTPSSLLRKLEI
nr:zinc finger, CCHC-type [Tanacetum cinerariifolium]